MCNKHVKNVFIQLFYILLLVNAYHQYRLPRSSRSILSRILSSNSGKKPVILLLDLSKKSRDAEVEEGYKRDEEDESIRDYDYHEYAEKKDDQGAYNLYKLLSDLKEADSSSYENFEDTKHALRTALRARCGRVDDCVQQCPPKKPACPKKCKKQYDSSNICPPPPPPPCPKPDCCNKPKCGKTMPPYWLL